MAHNELFVDTLKLAQTNTPACPLCARYGMNFEMISSHHVAITTSCYIVHVVRGPDLVIQKNILKVANKERPHPRTIIRKSYGSNRPPEKVIYLHAQSSKVLKASKNWVAA